MMLIRILWIRWRVKRAVRMLQVGRIIIEREERRMGLAPPGWCWRVPNVRLRT